LTDKNRFSKPVAFNKKNTEDKLILEHVKRRNFSGYVKKLILEDMKVRGKIKDVETEPVLPPTITSSQIEKGNERLERLKLRQSESQQQPPVKPPLNFVNQPTNKC